MKASVRRLGMCALLLPAVAGAQSAGGDAASRPAVQLPGVVVTATRQPSDALLVPAAIDAIDARDIRRAQPTIHLSESLQRIPGVVARDRQNHAQDLQISIRGFGARSTFGVRGVRLYTDGIPATMPDGQGQVSHFALSSAERIEVLRGPFSALYGNASGGVIELFSAPPPADRELEAGGVAGSDGLHRAWLGLRGPLDANGRHGFSLDTSQVEVDGYRDHSAARRRNAQAMVKGQAGDDTHYTVLFNGVDIVADDPQGLTAAELAGDRRAASPNSLRFDARKTVRQQQAGARFEHTLSPAHTLVFTGYAGNRQTAQMLTVPVAVQAPASHGGGAIDLDRDYHGADLRWRWSTQWFARPLSVVAGLQRETSQEARRGYENFVGGQLGVRGARRRDERNRVTSADQYLQAQWQWHERWSLNVGARHSRVRFRSHDHYITPGNPDDSGALSYARTSPVAGLLFRATPWLSLYANAGSGFETPTFAELAYRADGRSGLNDGLRAARSRNLEAGLRARRGELAYSAALFHTRTDDELVVVSNQGGRSVFGNGGQSRRRGVELAVSHRIAPAWQYAGAYTFLDARYLEDVAICATPPCASGDRLIEAGRQLPGLSRHTAWGELRWSPDPRLDVLLEGRFVDRVFVDDRNSARAPAYATVDLGIERRFDAAGLQWRGFARLNNLFDRQVIGSVIVNEASGRYFEPAPGRNWVLGLSATRAFK